VPAFLDRLRHRLRGGATPVLVLGRDAAVTAQLRAAGAELVEAAADAELVVVLDPDLAPVKLPRRPLRVGIVARGAGEVWAASDAVEDVDGVVVATDADAAAVAHRTVLPPGTVADLGRGALELATSLGARPRLHLLTDVSNLRMRPRWGDHHYAVATAKALGRHGWLTRSWCQAELADGVDHREADAALLLAGGLDLRPVDGVPTVAWVIYPRALDTTSLRDLDHVHVASPTVAGELAADGVAASYLPQATDATRFRPTPGGRHHELLFVANSRNVRRRVTEDLLPTEHELAIYGYGWTPELVDVRHVVADQVGNAALPALYTAADVVLNDHWDEMRAGAYLSNRLFDAAACGATVVTDRIAGLDDVFGGSILAYDDRDHLRRLIDELLADPGRRRDLGERARDVVLAGHTFDHRVAALLATLPTSPSPARSAP
jgi:glycosyltransferase involved in cell wall biosynthesis